MKCAVCQTAHFFFLIDPEEEAFLKGALEAGKPGLKAPSRGVERIEPGFPEKEVSICRKCLLLSGQMLTSF